MALAAAQQDDWRSRLYPQLMSQLLVVAPNGVTDTVTSQVLPGISALDTVAIIGRITPGVLNALGDFAAQMGRDRKEVARSTSEILAVGQYDDYGVADPATIGDPKAPDVIDGPTYLQYVAPSSLGIDGHPWQRYSAAALFIGNPIPGTGVSYEPFTSYMVVDTGSDAVLGFVRQLIADYQRMLDCSVTALQASAANTAAPMPDAEQVTEFFSAIAAVCVDLDVLKANPLEWGDIAGALRYSLGKTSEFVGKTAAEIAGEVGKDVGLVSTNLLGGFLEHAGILSIVVVAIAIKYANTQ